jgi:hypothetical protein
MVHTAGRMLSFLFKHKACILQTRYNSHIHSLRQTPRSQRNLTQANWANGSLSRQSPPLLPVVLCVKLHEVLDVLL